MRADRTKNGVPLPDDTWAAIVNTAREVGVSEVSIQRATAVMLCRHCESAAKQSIGCQRVHHGLASSQVCHRAGAFGANPFGSQ